MGHGDYHFQHEPILGGRNQTTLWSIDRPKRSSEHPTMKPVALCARAIKNSSKAGDLVLDIFAGSGSTLMAAEQLGRRAFLMELDPLYCDVIRQRWEAAHGQAD